MLVFLTFYYALLSNSPLLFFVVWIYLFIPATAHFVNRITLWAHLKWMQHLKFVSISLDCFVPWLYLNWFFRDLPLDSTEFVNIYSLLTCSKCSANIFHSFFFRLVCKSMICFITFIKCWFILRTFFYTFILLFFNCNCYAVKKNTVSKFPLYAVEMLNGYFEKLHFKQSHRGKKYSHKSFTHLFFEMKLLIKAAIVLLIMTRKKNASQSNGGATQT